MKTLIASLFLSLSLFGCVEAKVDVQQVVVQHSFGSPNDIPGCPVGDATYCAAAGAVTVNLPPITQNIHFSPPAGVDAEVYVSEIDVTSPTGASLSFIQGVTIEISTTGVAAYTLVDYHPSAAPDFVMGSPTTWSTPSGVPAPGTVTFSDGTAIQTIQSGDVLTNTTASGLMSVYNIPDGTPIIDWQFSNLSLPPAISDRGGILRITASSNTAANHDWDIYVVTLTGHIITPQFSRSNTTVGNTIFTTTGHCQQVATALYSIPNLASQYDEFTAKDLVGGTINVTGSGVPGNNGTRTILRAVVSDADPANYHWGPGIWVEATGTMATDENPISSTVTPHSLTDYMTGAQTQNVVTQVGDSIQGPAITAPGVGVLPTSALTVQSITGTDKVELHVVTAGDDLNGVWQMPVGTHVLKWTFANAPGAGYGLSDLEVNPGTNEPTTGGIWEIFPSTAPVHVIYTRLINDVGQTVNFGSSTSITFAASGDILVLPNALYTIPSLGGLVDTSVLDLYTSLHWSGDTNAVNNGTFGIKRFYLPNSGDPNSGYYAPPTGSAGIIVGSAAQVITPTTDRNQTAVISPAAPGKELQLFPANQNLLPYVEGETTTFNIAITGTVPSQEVPLDVTITMNGDVSYKKSL